MITIALQLPDSLHDRLREVAEREEMSMNQLVTLALAETLSALDTEQDPAERAARGERGKFERAMSKAADGPPPEYDR